MSSIDERILQNIARAEQKEHQQQAQEARAKRKQAAIDRDRNQFIGQIVSQYFPEVRRFQPHRTHAENQREFAPLIQFLSELSCDKEYISMLQKKVNRELQE